MFNVHLGTQSSLCILILLKKRVRSAREQTYSGILSHLGNDVRNGETIMAMFVLNACRVFYYVADVPLPSFLNSPPDMGCSSGVTLRKEQRRKET